MRRSSRNIFCPTRKRFLTPRRSSRGIRDCSTRLGRASLTHLKGFTGEGKMAVDIVMPQMGESIFEGTITKWFKKPGDKVERDEPLFEISTDKVDAEIPSPVAGVLTEIRVNAGETVSVNSVVAVIGQTGEAAATPAAQTRPEGAPPKASPQADGAAVAAAFSD